MTDKTEDPFGLAAMAATWMKSMGEFWGPLSDQWSGGQEQRQAGAKPGNDEPPKGQAALAAALKNWQAISSAMATPESMAALLKSSGTMPEVLMSLAQTSLGSFLELQQNMLQRLGRLGESAEAYEFIDIDENIFRIWSDIYEKEFHRFFQIPQLGLLRTYQEKLSRVADKYNLFQSNLSEFLRLLGLPFSRSLQVMQEKLGRMAEAGELPDDTRDYYNLWVRVLEGHFMTLFQTPEYVETLSRTINSLADFSASRDAALEDMLSSLPVAKKSEMDELGRELYEIKKRLRKLEQN